MSEYNITYDFSVKDGLESGNSNKLIRGSEFDTEFNAIKAAILTKADLASPALLGVTTAVNLTVSGTTTLAGTLAGTFTIDGGTF